MTEEKMSVLVEQDDMFMSVI